MTSNRCIPIKNTLGLKCSRVLCVRVIHLFSVVFYEVRALHKFDTKRVINETPMKWLSVFNKTTSCSDRDSCILTGYIPYPRTGVARDFTRALKVNCILLSKRLCIRYEAQCTRQTCSEICLARSLLVCKGGLTCCIRLL